MKSNYLKQNLIYPIISSLQAMGLIPINNQPVDDKRRFLNFLPTDSIRF